MSEKVTWLAQARDIHPLVPFQMVGALSHHHCDNVTLLVPAGMTTTNEITSDAKNKRLRRKKTFSELKDEESSLLKERVQLTEKIATKRETVKEQGVRNENLKRLKHDLALHSQSGFVLPDLNMMPSEDDSQIDTLYGTS
ncbi:hypothetical protein ACFE04_016948 [Oxalis oulophora]